MQWPVTLDVVVRWRDLDGAGHVNNANYFSYFEAARTEAYYKCKGIEPREARIEDLDIILARTACDFRSAARMGETLRVSCWPTRVGESSFAMRYEIHEATTQRLVAEGDSVQVCFDYAAERKRPVPPDVRRALEAGL